MIFIRMDHGWTSVGPQRPKAKGHPRKVNDEVMGAGERKEGPELVQFDLQQDGQQIGQFLSDHVLNDLFYPSAIPFHLWLIEWSFMLLTVFRSIPVRASGVR